VGSSPVRAVWLAVVLSLVPVIAFLGALRTLDTYKLVTLRRIFTAIAAGCGAALVALPINTLMFSTLGSPLVEELLKAIFPLWCIRSHRVGFPVDAGIVGFATGAGFSLVENVLYIHSIPDGTPVELFAEGPSADWALPVPTPVAGGPAGSRRFAFDIDGLPPGATADGAIVTLTAVCPDAAIEVATRLD